MLATLLMAVLGQVAGPEQQVICAELAFSRSAEDRDPAAFASLIHEDARFTGGGGVLRGRDAVTKAWGVFLLGDGPSIRWAPDVTEVLQSGDLALSQGPYEVRETDADGRVKLTAGRFMSVWRRQEDGSWLIVFDGGTPASPVDASTVDPVLEMLGESCTMETRADNTTAD